ncbi:hypothetical protein [Brevundimonas sp.]|uniref:hypothetical protein n=1 Tax=Brevundimonas sp. TaxID=1871086 RepID=UPI001D2FDBC3|nr:hypothetical protein [Brevundimonas sp.]MBL0948656.1 hypothetical protein [Brevundimonas sp.]
MRIGASVIAALVLTCAAPVAAQDPDLLRQAGVDARDQVLANMTLFQCGGEPCAAATAEEMASPPLSDDEAGRVAGIALMSALAEHCGLDWSGQSFMPMMREWRMQPGGSNRKYALIGGVHGFVQAEALDAFRANGECDEQTRAAVQATLDDSRD